MTVTSSVEEFTNCLFSQMTVEEMEKVDGGLVITIGTVTLILTAKGVAAGVAAVAAAYAAGTAVGQGLAYIKK